MGRLHSNHPRLQDSKAALQVHVNPTLSGVVLDLDLASDRADHVSQTRPVQTPPLMGGSVERNKTGPLSKWNYGVYCV